MAACVPWHARQRLDASAAGRLPLAACAGSAEVPVSAAGGMPPSHVLTTATPAVLHKHHHWPQHQAAQCVPADAGDGSSSPHSGSVSGGDTVHHSGLLALLTSGESVGMPPSPSAAARGNAGSPATPSSWDSSRSHNHTSTQKLAAPPAAATAGGGSGERQHQPGGPLLRTLQPLALLPLGCGGSTAGAAAQQQHVWTLQQRWALAQRRQQWLLQQCRLQQQHQAAGMPPQQMASGLPARPGRDEAVGGTPAAPATVAGGSRKRSRSSRVSPADMVCMASMLDPPAAASAWPPPMDTVTAAKRLRKMSDRDILLLAARAVTSKPAPDGAVSSPPLTLPCAQQPAAPAGSNMQLPAAEQRPAMARLAAPPVMAPLPHHAPAAAAQQRHSGASAAAAASRAAAAVPSLRLPDCLPTEVTPAGAVPSLPTAAAAAAAWGSSQAPCLLDADDGMLHGDWGLADLLEDVFDG